ncbi:CD2 antigen cytoplasmic tail-binding 2 [Chlorella sorokiniana]|uniref:CD2 antigen cytoplasmic tail-binding 2 n=1 Tax=Chlorella sorokiniana TaxID=3076 RepID=A0A2P6TXP9_CHLSO|nr:CD2 antigen cytoplasmic tail-binding 2 [Chlorella sorokiniana]|eukprot:PRW58842.1 CD2 antigen cytoplasmic tail-binding 2 [Chlorella sorokiniana]
MSSSSGSKKRVRFSDAGPQVHEYEVEPKKRALDPMEQLEGEISGVCLNPSGDVDAGQAAAQRAACRRNQLLAAFDEGAGMQQGDDVEGEEDYEDPEEMFDSVTGVPIEPFHLKREREEGYFDEDGTYVEYKRDEVEDAWADSLANVEVDEDWLTRVLGGRGRAEASSAAAAAAGEAPDMSAEEIRERKRRIVDLLLPGENVLQALRRLAAVRQPARGAVTTPAATSGGATGGSPDADTLARGALKGPAMPPAVQEKFEQLTELSSVLMDQGEYSVHSMTREQLERSIQDGGSGAEQGGGSAAGAAPIVRQPAAASASGNAGQQLAERLLAAAAGAGGGGGGGQNGSSKGPANGAAGGGGEDAAPAAQQAAADADLEDMFAEQEPATAGSANADPARPSAHSSAAPAAGQPSEQPQQAQQGDAGSIQRDASGDAHMQEAEQPEAAAQQQAAQQAGGAAAGTQPQQTQAQEQPQGAAAGGQPPELDGFVLDQSTGLWYNSDLGMYFDSGRRLFGDSSSGQWYSYDAASGQYTPVPSAS